MSTAETPQSIDATPMADTERQTAGGKVLWHFTMSLDGFVAGPNHAMDWMTGISSRPGLVEEYAETTGAVLGGRDGFDAYPDVSGIYGGAWQGPVFVLTHHPEDAQPADGVTFLSCDVAEAVRIGLEAAGRAATAHSVASHRSAASDQRVGRVHLGADSRQTAHGQFSTDQGDELGVHRRPRDG
jgi:hypothetical protein